MEDQSNHPAQDAERPDETIVVFDRQLDDLHIAVEEIALAIRDDHPARIHAAAARIESIGQRTEVQLGAVADRTRAMVRHAMLARVRLDVARDALRAVLETAADRPGLPPVTLRALERLAGIAARPSTRRTPSDCV